MYVFGGDHKNRGDAIIFELTSYRTFCCKLHVRILYCLQFSSQDIFSIKFADIFAFFRNKTCPYVN